MKIDVQGILSDLKASALGLEEKAAIVAVDSVLGSVRKQCAAQAGDAVAGVVGLVLTGMQPAVDAELNKLMPDAAKA